jgi:hypothetical protein
MRSMVEVGGTGKAVVCVLLVSGLALVIHCR